MHRFKDLPFPSTLRQRSTRKRPRGHHKNQLWNRLVFDRLEERILLTTVSFEESLEKLSVQFTDADASIHLSEVIGLSGDLLLQYRVGDGVYTTDFDTVEAGDQQIFLDQLDRPLAIEVGGDQAMQIGSLHTRGQDLSVEAEGTISVASEAIVSTRNVAVEGVDVDAGSLGDSGSIVFSTTDSILIEGDLFSQVEAGSPFQPGGITLEVSDTSNIYSDADKLSVEIRGSQIEAGEFKVSVENKFRKFAKQVVGTDTNTVEVTVSDSEIAAETIEIDAVAEDAIGFFDGDYKWFGTMIAGSLVDGFVGKGLEHVFKGPWGSFMQWPTASVFLRDASSTVTIEGSTLKADGSISLTSEGTVESEAESIQDRHFGGASGVEVAVGYARATGKSVTTLRPLGNTPTVLTAGGDVTIQSEGTAKALAHVRTMSQYPEKSGAELDVKSPASVKMIAVAITDADLTVINDIQENVLIESGGTVTVEATGTPQSIPNASTRAYGDGMGGVTVAVGTDTSNITTTVNGQITANQIQSSNDTIALPQQQITSDTLPYDASRGWERGDEVIYQVTGFDGIEPITGLEHGQPYYIVELLQDAIKLANVRELELDLPPGDFSSQQSIDVYDVLTFSPAVAVSGNQIHIDNHGLETAEEVQYLAMASNSEEAQEFEPIGGLYDQQAYYVIRRDANTIELAASPTDAINGNAIALTDQGKGDQQGLGYVVETIAFDPRQALDPSSNTLSVDTTGIVTGTRLVYNTDASVSRPMTTVKNHLFMPQPSSIEFDPLGIVQLTQLEFDLSSNLLVIPNHGLRTGDSLIYDLESGAVLQPTESEALTDGQQLYAIVVDEDRFQLALTSQDASNAKSIVFQPPDSGQHRLRTSSGRPLTFDPTADVVLPVVDAIQNNIFFPTPHGLVTGQRVIYQAGNGNTVIGGLVSGQDYYVSVINRSGIQLAESRDRLAAGEMVDLSVGVTASSEGLHTFQAFQVDAQEDWIVTPNHGLETGQSVVYNAQGEGAIQGLVDGRQYYVVRITPDIVRLAATVENASEASRGDVPARYLSLGAVGSHLQQTLESTTFARTFDAGLQQPTVDVDNNTLRIAYPWVTGQRVNYQTSGGDPIGGLQDAYNYFVVDKGENSIGLANSWENAQTGVILDLTSAGSLGSGLHLFNILPDVTILGESLPSVVFDPTEVPPINAAESTLRISQHGWETGQQLTYLTEAGTAIPELVNGGVYYVIKIDDDHFRLAGSADHAAANDALSLQNGATGDRHAFEWEQTFTANDPPIKGLLAGQAYFAVVDSPQALRLAETQIEAELAEVIQYDTTNYQNSLAPSLSASDPTIAGIEISAGTTTSTKNQSLAGAGLGGKPNFNDFLTKPELVWNSSAWKDSFSRGRFAGAAKGDVPIALAAAGAFTDVQHTIKAFVNGELETTGDLSIEATHHQNSKVFAKGTGSSGGGKTFALAAGIGVGIFENNVIAEVGSQAQLDASGTIEIQSNLAYARLKYPTVKDGVATAGHKNQSNPANWPPTIAKWISPTLGVDSYLNVWANSVVFKPDKVSETPSGETTDAYDKRATTSITGSAAYVDYKNSSQAIVRDNARINQKELLRGPDQEVSVDAMTTMTLIGLSGSIKVNILRGLMSWNLGTAFSAFGSKAKTFAMGLSVLDVKTDNTTLALVESEALVHTGAAGLSVKSDEDIETTLIAETGSESDGVGLGLSGTRSDHQSVTLSQLDAGVVYEGGELQLGSNSQVRPVVVSGSLVSGGDAGIGASGSWTTLDRKTGSFIGPIPSDWADSYQVASRSSASASNGELGVIDAESVSVNAENSGDVYSFSVVSAIPTFRIAKKPKDERFGRGGGNFGEGPLEKELDGGSFDLSLAGDTAINAVNDATWAQIDADGFQRIDVESTGNEALSIQAHNPTHYVVASGAGAISKGKRDGTAVAVAGSVAWNILDLETDAKITDSHQSATHVPITVAGDVLVFASTGEQDTGHDIDDTEAAIWAVSGSLGVAVSGDFTVSIAFSASINDLVSTTDAVIEHVALTAGTDGVSDSGQVEIQAVSNHTITGDGGGFAISYGQAALDEDPEGGGSLSVAFGGSYAYNFIDSTIDARVGGATTVDANSLDVSAEDGSSIMNVTIAGAVDAGFSKGGSAFTFAGATNQITRNLGARIGRDDDEDHLGPTMVNVSQSLTVAATDQAQIKAIGTGVAFNLSLRPKGTFSGSIGASWATNRITDDSSVTATIANAEIKDSSAAVKVLASSQATIETWAVQIGVVMAFNFEEGILTSDVNGAMAFNDVGGTVLAEITDQTVIHSLGTVEVMAESASEIRSEIINISLSISLSVVNIGIGLTLAENDLHVSVGARVNQSTINTNDDLKVTASATETIEAIGSNASLAIAVSLEGTSVDVGLLGLVTLNTVDGETYAVISGSRVDAGGDITVGTTDHSTITAKGVGAQFSFAVASGTAVELNAMMQWTTNDVTREVDAGIESTEQDATVINSAGQVSVSAEKTAFVLANLYTLSFAIAGSSGSALAIGGSDTSVVNRLEKTDDSEHASATIASIAGASVTAAQVEVTSQSTPQLQSEVLTVDGQGAFGGDGALALVAGVSTIDSTLSDHVEASIKGGANVVTTVGDLIVQAALLSKESTEDDPQQSLYLGGVTVGASVSFSADLVSFAGTEVGSYLNYESASTVSALIEDSNVDAKGDIDLDATDETTAFSETRDWSFAASVASVAAATPVTDGEMANVVSAEIIATNQVAASGSDPVEVRSQNGNITADANSVTSSEMSTLVITGQIGLGFSTDVVFAKSLVVNQTSANVRNDAASHALKIEALKGDVSVVAFNDDHSKNSVTSGDISVGVAAFDFVKLTSLHSPSVNSQISGDTFVDAWNVNVHAVAEGGTTTKSQQDDFSLGFPVGTLRQNVFATPVVKASVGEVDTEDDSEGDESNQWQLNPVTNVNAGGDIRIVTHAMTDASGTANMIGGSLIATIMTPKVVAVVDPVTEAVLGQDAKLTAGGVIAVDVHAGFDENSHPGNFNASLGVDPAADTIEFDLPQGHRTGDVLRYENFPDDGTTTSSSIAPVAGLTIGRDYRVIGLDETMVQIGEVLDSSINTVDLETEILTFSQNNLFNGPFDDWSPEKWDVIVYRQQGPEPIEGLVDGQAYWVNQQTENTLRLYEYAEDVAGNPLYPVAPLAVDGGLVTASQFAVANHRFKTGQAVSYLAPDRVTFSVDYVNADVSADPDTGEPLLTEEESNFSSTIYVGDDITRFTNGQLVEYQVEATSDQWFWVTGNEADPHSDPLLGEQFWQGTVGGSAVDGVYTNWAAAEPDNKGDVEVATQMDSNGEWSDVRLDSVQTHYLLGQPQFVLMQNLGEMSYGEAVLTAAAKEGWLPSIQTEDEYNAAVQAAAGNAVWLGGSDWEIEDVWLWSTGSLDPNNGEYFWQGQSGGYVPNGTDFTLWANGEPNDQGRHTKHHNREQFLEMNSAGEWNDLDDSHRRHVLVEYPTYKLISFTGTFSEARLDAIERGGWIARIPDHDANELARQLLVDHNVSSAWIGGTRDQAITGLKSGDRYFVDIIQNDSDHPNSVKLKEVTSSGDPGDFISLDRNGKVETITHSLIPVEQLPLEGLVSEVTYYVIQDSPDHFRLAASPEDAQAGISLPVGTIDVDPKSSLPTTNGLLSQVGTTSADLTSIGEGEQRFVFDIDKGPPNIQSLQLVRAASKPENDGTGTASSSVSTTGGSLIDVTGDPKGYSNSFAAAGLKVAPGAELRADEVELVALSAGNVYSHVNSHTGAAASDSRSRAKSAVDSTSLVQVEGLIHADRTVTIVSENSDNGKASATTQGGGIVTTQVSNASVSGKYQNLLHLLSSARIQAGEAIHLTASTTFDGKMTSDTDSNGVFGDSKANNSDGMSFAITDTSENRNATKIIIDDAMLIADNISLTSELSGVDTDESFAHAAGKGMQNKQRAIGQFDIESDVTVEIGESALIVAEILDIVANVGLLDVNIEGYTYRGRLASEATANLNYDTDAKINAAKGAIIHADVIRVDAQQNVDQQKDLRLHAYNHRGSNSEENSNITGHQSVDWNATVLGKAKANLEIDPQGKIVTLEGVDLNQGSLQLGNVAPADQAIFVTDVPFDFNEQLTMFSARPTDSTLPGDSKVTGDALFYAVFFADLENQSDRDLVVRDVDLEGAIDDQLETKVFWQGGSNGSALNGAYTNWLSGQPTQAAANDNYLLLRSSDGKWVADSGGLARRYILATDSGYELSDQSYTFDAALADAKTRGGTMAAVTSEAENVLIWGLSKGNDVWLNGTDSLQEGTWTRPERPSVVTVDAADGSLNIRRSLNADESVPGAFHARSLYPPGGQSAADILLAGDIHNPNGRVDISSRSGNILTASGQLFWSGNVDGSAANGTYTNWNTGEPNDYGGIEDYAVMYANGTWNDIRGDNRYRYVLETDSGYQFINQEFTIDAAKADAAARGGRVAWPTTQSENDTVSSLAGNSIVWIDGSDSLVEGMWLRPRRDELRLNARDLQIEAAQGDIGGDLLLVISESTRPTDPQVTNGDFETSASSFTVWPGYTGGGNPSDVSGWTGGGGHGINPIADGGSPFRDNGGNSTHVAFLQGSSYLEQTVRGFKTGKIYSLGIDFNSRNCCGDVPLASVYANGVLIGNLSSTPNSTAAVQPVGGNQPWYHTDLLFRADAKAVTIRVSTEASAEGDSTLVIDNVVVSATTLGSSTDAVVSVVSGGDLSLDISGEPDAGGRFRGIERLEGATVDVGLRRWNDTLETVGTRPDPANDVATHYLISGFNSPSQFAANHQEILANGDIRVQGLRSDGTSLSSGDKDRLLSIDANATIAGDSGQLSVFTNGSIAIRDGVDRTWQLVLGSYTFAQAMAEAAVNDAWLATIRNANEDYLVNEAMDGYATWYGGTDARQEGQWTWLTGEIFRTPFYLGDYRTGTPIDGRFEQWKRDPLSTEIKETNPDGQVEPDDQQSDEDFLIMDTEGNWVDVNGEQVHAYVLETETDLQLIHGNFVFADAWLDAYQRGGWIAVADTAERYQQIRNLTAGQSIWLGATDAKSEGLWEWLTPFYSDSAFWTGGADGEAVNDAYSSWNNGEPNNLNNREDFLQRLTNGLWNDLPSDNWGSPLPYLMVQEHVRSNNDRTQIGDIVSTHGDIQLDVSGNAYLSGRIETRENGTFTWDGDGQLLDANVGAEQQPRIKTRMLQLGSMGGLGEVGQPLPIAVEKIRSEIERQPVHSVYVSNAGAPLSLGGLVVYEGDLHVISDQSLVVDAPVTVEGGGNLTLVSNGLGQDSATGVSLEYFRAETDVTYTNWASGEPNGCCGGANYVQMYANGTWDDTDGSYAKGGYILELNGEYSFVGGSFTWAQAAVDARSKSGQLATIQNEAEQILASQHTGGTTVWIGATKPAHADDWQWVVENGYQNWNLSQPDNWQGTEHFVHMRSDGVWNDLPGDYQLGAYLLENEQGFRLVSGNFNWFQAYRDALAKGGQLATIRNQTEQDRAEAAAGGISAWIGATDIDDPGNWKWLGQESLIVKEPVITSGGNGNINLLGSSGILLKNNDEIIRFEKPFWPDTGGYSNWQTGEPNNCCGGQSYAQMYSWGNWDDAGGSTVLNGYILEVDGEYSFVGGSFNWWQAAYDAQSQGGHLAVIETADEQARAAEHTNGMNVWIGATDEGHEGKWTWVVPKNFENWAVGEPNNEGDVQDYLRMYSSGEWDDTVNSDTRGYLLEIDGRFQLVRGSFTWHQADADARDRGGHLATILSETEQLAARAAANGLDVWLGATDVTQEGVWKWIDTPVTEPATLVSSSGQGQIVLAAGTRYDQGRVQEGDSGAEILMEPGSRIASDFGNVILMAASDVFLSQIATHKHQDGNGGAVLVVADYDGVTGQRVDGEGTIRGVGMATHVTADRAVFVAEGRHDLQGWGIGRDVDPIRTQVSQLAALTDFGDVAIENVGDLRIGRVDVPMKGVLKDSFDARSVVPMKTIPERISELNQADEAPEYNNSDGVFSVSGVAILDAGGILGDRYHLSVTSDPSLTVLVDTPVINLSAGPIVLSALTDQAASTVFEVVQGNFTWDQAFNNAVARGGRLANITTPEITDALTTLVSDDYWVGGSDALSEGNWYWLYPQDDGTAVRVPLSYLDYTRWNSGEPDNRTQIQISVADVQASSQYGARLAERVIDGSGLINNASHVIAPDGNMWLSNGTLVLPNDTDPQITFDLGRSQKLDHMRVWNYNEDLPGRPELLKRGVMSADILVAGEDQRFTLAVSNRTFNQAPGNESIDFSQIVPLSGIEARYVRLDNMQAFPGADFNFVGLSEVQFFTAQDGEDFAQLRADGHWSDSHGSQQLGYVLEHSPSSELDIRSPIFTSGGLNEIRLYEGAPDLLIAQPIPDDTCNSYRYLNSQGDLIEGSAVQLSLDVCLEPTQNAAGSLFAEGENADLKFFFSLNELERDASTYADGIDLTRTTVTFEQSGLQTVYIRVLHSDGAYTDYQRTLEIADQAAADLMVERIGEVAPANLPVTLSGSFVDSSDNDVHVAIIEWGDDTPDTVVLLDPAEQSFSSSHTYAQAGQYSTTVTVVDSSTGESLASSSVQFVNGVSLHGDELQIIGTLANDLVTVEKQDQQLVVHADFNRNATGPTDNTQEEVLTETYLDADVASLTVWLGDGVDRLVVAADVEQMVDADGGADDDYLTAGAGAANFVGGEGDDFLSGSPQDDSLLGGLGQDWIIAKEGDDHLDGGPGADRMFAGSGHDQVVSDGASEFIFGGDDAGHDQLVFSTDAGVVDLTELTGPMLQSIESIRLLDSENVSLRIDVSTVIASTDSRNHLLLATDDYSSVELGSDWTSAGFFLADGIYHRQYQTNSTIVDVMGPIEWHNSADALDVTADGFISPVDGLFIVNELNSRRFTGTNGQLMLAGIDRVLSEVESKYFGFLDVTNDTYVTPFDLLLVVNHLNRRPLVSGGEAEPDDDNISNPQPVRFSSAYFAFETNRANTGVTGQVTTTPATIVSDQRDMRRNGLNAAPEQTVSRIIESPFDLQRERQEVDNVFANVDELLRDLKRDSLKSLDDLL